MTKRQHRSAATNAGTSSSAKAKGKQVSRTSPPGVKMEEFLEFFKDPPNVDDLLNRRPQAPAGTARPDDDNFRFSMSSTGGDFKALADELRKCEPSMMGVTGYALHSLYERVVSKRRELEKFLEVATGISWTPTTLTDIALELVSIDDDILQRQERKTAAKEGLITEADARDTRILIAATTTRRSRRAKAARISLDHQVVYHARSPASQRSLSTPPPTANHPSTSANQPSMIVFSAQLPPDQAPRAQSIRSSTSTKSLFTNEEQEAFIESTNTKPIAIARAMQEMATDVSEMKDSYDARIKILEMGIVDSREQQASSVLDWRLN
ncbi:hypothetical protein BGZ65_008725 [Modicella reniformis]|uniref:Uncharacterized protein n=1 Tax=Modicella reniformis TaxID=1440133 RepID=A0A9P6JGL2_9FUNG|nr:hypothetical protein BGZ65_008725 [Modicella reniformis]